jgi:hypothetical protein
MVSLIISLANEQPEVTGWLLRPGAFDAVEVLILPT